MIESSLVENTARPPEPAGDEFWRWTELAVAFLGIPVLIGWWVPPVAWIPSLWLIAGAATWRLWRAASVRPHGFWARIDWRRAAPELRRIGRRFALAAGLLVVATAWWLPERLWSLPREKPGWWLALMVLYPLLSVYPQEVVYRRYLFHGLGRLRVGQAQIAWVSAGVFAAMHAIFRNEIAVGLTLIGGWLFADTYRRTGSLRLVCLEHALYGNLVFTIGLGEFFFHGAVRG